jgi:hypothetical protein
MNELEKFVRTNRDRFDSQQPPDALWQRIEARLPATHADPTPTPVAGPITENTASVRPLNSRVAGAAFSKSMSVNWLLVASVSGLLLLAGLWFVNRQYGVTQQPEVVAVSPGYAKEFVQYARLIDDKRDELRQMTQANPVLYAQFAGDLDKLETGYQSLKADLPQNPNQELLIQAMIQNLQLQIDLLNQQLRVIQQMKQQTTTHHDPIL